MSVFWDVYLLWEELWRKISVEEYVEWKNGCLIKQSQKAVKTVVDKVVSNVILNWSFDSPEDIEEKIAIINEEEGKNLSDKLRWTANLKSKY